MVSEGWEIKVAKDTQGNDREIFEKDFLASDLRSSLEIMGIVTAIATERKIEHDVTIMASPNAAHAALHIFGRGKLPKHYYAIAKEIDEALSSLMATPHT